VIFTLSTLMVEWQKPSAAWPALLIGYVVVGFCWYGNYSILAFNQNSPAHSELVGPASPATRDSRFLNLHS